MNYPTGVKRNNFRIVNYANRGMSLEKNINLSNKYYLDKDLAVIYKKPTPIQIIKVDYPSKNKAVIKEALFTTPSTLDYNGLYKGKYLDFDAKECQSKTSFPLANIHSHQILHMRNIIKHHGITFLIVHFVNLDELYLIFGEDLFEYVDKTERKSIPIAYFRERGHKIELGYIPRIDYLKIIDKRLKGE